MVHLILRVRLEVLADLRLGQRPVVVLVGPIKDVPREVDSVFGLGIGQVDRTFVSLGFPLGLSVIFHLHGAHIIRATVLCHFDILQLGILRFVAVRGNAMLGSWEQDTKANISMGEHFAGINILSVHIPIPTALQSPC